MIELTEPVRGWMCRWAGTLEIFTSPEGVEYVRASEREPADILVGYLPRLGLAPMRLRLLSESRIAKRIARRERRAKRELVKRGLA